MIFLPPPEVEDQLQLLALRCGLREVRKLDADRCDEELEHDRREYLRVAKQRSRKRGKGLWRK